MSDPRKCERCDYIFPSEQARNEHAPYCPERASSAYTLTTRRDPVTTTSALAGRVDGASLLGAVKDRVGAEKAKEEAEASLLVAQRREKLQPIFDILKDAFARRMVSHKASNQTVRVEVEWLSENTLRGEEVVVLGASPYTTGGHSGLIWVGWRTESWSSLEKPHERGYRVRTGSPGTTNPSLDSPDFLAVVTWVFERVARGGAFKIDDEAFYAQRDVVKKTRRGS